MYYPEAGTPPGRWRGSCRRRSSGRGGAVVGSQVSQGAASAPCRHGSDPFAGDPLGRAYPVHAPVAVRVAKLVADSICRWANGARGVRGARRHPRLHPADGHTTRTRSPAVPATSG